MISSHPPYSYKADPDVPDVEAGSCFTVMDANCALCARGAGWIARNDTRQEFRIVPIQSKLGQALLRHYGLDPLDPSTWLFVEDGQAFSSMEAVIRTGRRLGGIWRALSVLRILPRGAQDWLYGLVARNRYRLFGRADLCALPDPEVQRRLLQ